MQIYVHPSGDTDILVLAVTLLNQHKRRVFLDSGSQQNRRIIWMGNIDITDKLRNALIGYHAFTGNDYVSSFFLKSKIKCWKLIVNNKKFQNSFSALGDSVLLLDDIIGLFEEYVVQLYSGTGKNIDLVRSTKFTKKYSKENKIVDLSTLPPCSSVLRLHTMRANLVSFIWKR